LVEQLIHNFIFAKTEKENFRINAIVADNKLLINLKVNENKDKYNFYASFDDGNKWTIVVEDYDAIF
jgi:hypothetical protein